MNARLDLLLARDARHQRAIADVSLVKGNIVIDRSAVPSREVVQYDHAFAFRAQPLHRYAADISRAARHQNRHLEVRRSKREIELRGSGFFLGFPFALGLDGNFGVVQALHQRIERVQQGFHQRGMISVEGRARRGNAVQRLGRRHGLRGRIDFEQLEIVGHFVDDFAGHGFRWSTKALISACSLRTLVTRGIPRAYW